jgi:hypothetical protein
VAALSLRATNLPLDLSIGCPGRNGNKFADVLAQSCINLVARSIGVVSAAISSVGSGRSHCSSSDAYRHSTAYGCTTINATAIDTTVVNANTTNSNASPICEGVARDSRDKHDADDSGCGERDNKSARHD